MQKLTGQMAFFLEIQMETLGSFFLFNLHDDIEWDFDLFLLHIRLFSHMPHVPLIVYRCQDGRLVDL